VPCVQIFIKFQRTASNINDYGPSIKIGPNKGLIKSLLNILNHEFHISNIFFFLKKKKTTNGNKGYKETRHHESELSNSRSKQKIQC